MIYIPYYYVVLFSYGEAHQILPQVKLIWQKKAEYFKKTEGESKKLNVMSNLTEQLNGCFLFNQTIILDT